MPFTDHETASYILDAYERHERSLPPTAIPLPKGVVTAFIDEKRDSEFPIAASPRPA